MQSIARVLTGRAYRLAGLNTGIQTRRRSAAVDWSARIAAGPNLKDFLVVGKNLPDLNRTTVADVSADPHQHPPYLLDSQQWSGRQRRVYFEVYGCQMNVSDTEIVWAILQKADYVKVVDIRDADVVMLITCAIREGAETKVKYIYWPIHLICILNRV